MFRFGARLNVGLDLERGGSSMARISDYRFGRIVVDGDAHERDVIVLPDRVVGGWWRKNGHSLVIEDFQDVLDELPERLIVGSGANGQMHPEPAVLEALAERGVKVEVIRTGEAVERFNVADPQRTAAALHLTC
jgi:hypothetical protein